MTIPRLVRMLPLLLSALACGSREAEIARAEEAIRSWTATVRVVERARARGLIPEQYARHILSTAEEELRKYARTAGRRPGSGS